MEPIPEDFGGLLPRDTLTQEERQILLGEQQTATTSRTTDTLIRWYITPAMIAINGALLTFAAPRVLNGELVGAWIIAISLPLVYLWYQLEMRIYGLIEYWNGRLIAIAELLKPLVRTYGGEDWEKDVRGEKTTTHEILVWTIGLFGLAAVVFISAFVLSIVYPEYRKLFQTPTVSEERLQQKIENLTAEVAQLKQGAQELDALKQKVERLEQQQNVLLEQLRQKLPAKQKKGKRR